MWGQNALVQARLTFTRPPQAQHKIPEAFFVGRLKAYFHDVIIDVVVIFWCQISRAKCSQGRPLKVLCLHEMSGAILYRRRCKKSVVAIFSYQLQGANKSAIWREKSESALISGLVRP